MNKLCTCPYRPSTVFYDSWTVSGANLVVCGRLLLTIERAALRAVTFLSNQRDCVRYSEIAFGMLQALNPLLCSFFVYLSDGMRGATRGKGGEKMKNRKVDVFMLSDL